MMSEIEQEKRELEEMTEGEKMARQAEKAKLKALFRQDDDSENYYPLIIKANQAGSLETLLVETQKIIGQNY